MKNKPFSVTSNPSTLVYVMPSMIQFHSWLNLLTAAWLNQTWFKKYSPFSSSTIYNIKREDIMLEILYNSTIKRYGTSRKSSWSLYYSSDNSFLLSIRALSKSQNWPAEPWSDPTFWQWNRLFPRGFVEKPSPLCIIFRIWQIWMVSFD